MSDDNERFIHDELLRRATAAMGSIKEAWRRMQKIEPFLISWPAEHLEADDGSIITHQVLTELPVNKKERGALMLQAIERTCPYAILLAEEREDLVVVIFESSHGTHSWRYPIKNHGNVRILGKPKERDDVDCVGILWSPKTPEA